MGMSLGRRVRGTSQQRWHCLRGLISQYLLFGSSEDHARDGMWSPLQRIPIGRWATLPRYSTTRLRVRHAPGARINRTAHAARDVALRDKLGIPVRISDGLQRDDLVLPPWISRHQVDLEVHVKRDVQRLPLLVGDERTNISTCLVWSQVPPAFQSSGLNVGLLRPSDIEHRERRALLRLRARRDRPFAT